MNYAFPSVEEKQQRRRKRTLRRDREGLRERGNFSSDNKRSKTRVRSTAKKCLIASMFCRTTTGCGGKEGGKKRGKEKRRYF
jgi:hypothetical protein